MNRSSSHATPLALAGVLLLAACGWGDPEAAGQVELDPAAAQALHAPLMTDPDLAGLNEANAALTGSSDQSLPLPVTNAEAIRDAQDRATALAGGHSALVPLPPPRPITDAPGESPLVLLDETVDRLRDGSACLAGARYSAMWAAKLPASLPVYPRGAVTEALGRDGQNCALRAVRYASPVPAEDIMQFYATLATRERMDIAYSASGNLWRLQGSKANTAFLVEVRPSLLGGLEVDLVSASGTAVRRR